MAIVRRFVGVVLVDGGFLGGIIHRRRRLGGAAPPSEMSASEQMRAMLDQLMGTARNGKHESSHLYSILC